MQTVYKRYFKEDSLVQWYIVKTFINGKDETIHRFDTFNKSEIQKIFDKEAKLLKDGEQLDFCKDDAKYMGDIILTVVSRKGMPYIEVVKGNRVLYKPYKRMSN